MMYPIIIVIVLVVTLVILLVINKRLMKRDYVKAINELVKEGEITKEQGDAIIWMLFEYKPNKHKK